MSINCFDSISLFMRGVCLLILQEGSIKRLVPRSKKKKRPSKNITLSRPDMKRLSKSVRLFFWYLLCYTTFADVLMTKVWSELFQQYSNYCTLEYGIPFGREKYQMHKPCVLRIAQRNASTTQKKYYPMQYILQVAFVLGDIIQCSTYCMQE